MIHYEPWHACGCIASVMLNLWHQMDMSGQCHALGALLPIKSPHTIGWQAERSQSWSGHGSDEKSFCSGWELNPSSLIIQPIALVFYHLSNLAPYYKKLFCKIRQLPMGTIQSIPSVASSRLRFKIGQQILAVCENYVPEKSRGW